MPSNRGEKSAKRPPVHVIDTECDRLIEMALGIEGTQPEVAAMLLAELDRADVCSAETLPADTVTMNSHVEFIDEGNGSRRTAQIVYPAEADISEGRISVLTPVGAGLIGLRAGHAIVWPDREGHSRTLRIVSVTPPPEAPF